MQADAKPCSSVEDLFTNFDWGLGHGDPTTLLQDKGGGWDVWPGGVSQLSGDTWTLEFGQVF